MMARGAARLEVFDPGFARTRRGARTACATVLSGLTLAVVTSMFGVAEPLPITLFGAGACFFGALLVTDAHRSDRAHTFGWASVVSAVAIVVTVELSRTAVWAAVAFLVLQMFLSYALRPWSPRAGNLAVIGALTTFLAGAGHITSDRIGWFVLASTVGFAWATISEYAFLPDNPVRTLKRSVYVFCRSAGDAVFSVVDTLTITCDGNAPDGAARALRRSIHRVMRCRTAIESQVSGALLPGFGQHDVEQLRVALYCAERGIEEVSNQTNDPRWINTLPDDIARSITSTLQALAKALRGNIDAQSLDAVARELQYLRDHLHDATTTAPKANDEPRRPPGTALAALTTVGGAQLVAQSTSQATALATVSPASVSAGEPASAAAAQTRTDTPTAVRTLSPTMALAIQAAVAAVLAGLIAKSLGNEQSLLVAWTAYVIIAGSAEASTRRAWIWLAATILGATAGVAIAASVPDNVVWTVVVVTIGVFFTIVSAPVSYPAMVFWLSIALIPLFATEGRYLDLIWDKAVAALIGGCVAAAVALTVAPIRLSRDFRPAVLQYLDALDAALESQQPSERDRRATTGAALDRAHSALDSMIASALTKTHFFPQPGSPLTEQGVRVDAVHEAFLRLTPLLTDSSRRLHGWTGQRVEMSIRRLREDVEDAKAAARGDAAAVDTPARFDTRLESADFLWLTDNLHTRLAELALLLRGHPRLRAA
jgi:uncharacterized membrane protein YccC